MRLFEFAPGSYADKVKSTVLGFLIFLKNKNKNDKVRISDIKQHLMKYNIDVDEEELKKILSTLDIVTEVDDQYAYFSDSKESSDSKKEEIFNKLVSKAVEG